MPGIGARLAESFYQQSTEEVARQLLGMILVHETEPGILAGRIVECEMYQGPEDRGAHSYGGVPTPRTEVMYGDPGRAYVYMIYGMYFCLNVVTAERGTPHAILIRALEPMLGMDAMLRRQPPSKNPPRRTRIAAGPGKLCRAMGITREQYGHPLWQKPLYLAQPDSPWPPYRIARGARINIDYAGEAAAFPWRFWVHENPSVSVRPRDYITLESPRRTVPEPDGMIQ